MTEKQKLQTFRAGDLQAAKQQASSGRKKSSKNKPDAQAVAGSMGFERIERLLDEEVPGDVGQKLANLLDGLSEAERGAGSAKQKGSAKKARVAVERTIDLLDYLYQVKQGLLQTAIRPVARKEGRR